MRTAAAVFGAFGSLGLSVLLWAHAVLESAERSKAGLTDQSGLPPAAAFAFLALGFSGVGAATVRPRLAALAFSLAACGWFIPLLESVGAIRPAALGFALAVGVPALMLVTSAGLALVSSLEDRGRPPEEI
jgi:hypothetical protein